MCNEENKELNESLKEMIDDAVEAAEGAIDDAVEEAEEAIEDAEEALDDVLEEMENTEDEKTEGTQGETRGNDPQRFIRRTANGFEVDTSEIEKAFAVIGQKISEALGNVQKGVQDSINAAQDRAAQRRKADKLAQMLPFLDEAEIHDITEKILSGDESYKGLDIESLMPFMSKEDCGVLFEKSLEANDKEPGVDGKLYLKCVPFVDEAVLSKLVDRYVAGGFENIRMDNIYPYLSSADVKRIFYYELNK
ncbi:MAG: hypothetical protein IKG97_04010 [Lachnospiraceae bacterium]|nr:hypothetical protein [Lachnospiraceae bacterium]